MKILFVTEIPEEKKQCFTDLAGEDITFASRKEVTDEIGRASCRERVCLYV